MIALDNPGRVSGYVSFHNSTDVSAWQSIRLPIYCLNGRPGPTTLVMGGLHGDEYEGPVAIDSLANTLDTDKLVGRLILLPVVNVLAVMAGTRLTPDDGLNMNRAFPGNPHGSITQRIADWITQALVPVSDHVVDLHSGGRSLNFAPSILLHEVPGRAMNVAKLAAVAFGAPFTVLIHEDHADVMIDAVVEKLGKVMIASELGGSGTITHKTVRLATDGLSRMVAALGHLSTQENLVKSRLVRLPSSDTYLVSDDTMVFAPALSLGGSVRKGDTVGHGHFLDRIDCRPKTYTAPHDGWVICLAGQGLARRGDVIAIVAEGVQ